MYRGLSYIKGKSDIPLRTITMGTLIEESVEKFKDTVFISSKEQEINLTASEFLQEIDNFSAGLYEIGLKRGDKIGIIANNSIEAYIVVYSCIKGGFVANWEASMDQEETEEDSLTESASVSGDGGTYRDIQTREKDSNEIEANTESASANKEGEIEKSTDSNQKHFKAPVGGAKKNKRKAVDMEETNRRMEEAYEIMKQSQNSEPPKTTLCTAYGQLVAKRLETLSEVNRIIVMNEIDNLFFRATMGSMVHQYQSTSPGPASPASFYSSSMGPQYQSAFPGPASPASLYSSSSDETFHTTPRITSLLQNSANSSVHQPPLAPAIPTPTCIPYFNLTLIIL